MLEKAPLSKLADTLDTATTGGKLRFSVVSGEGWVTSHRESTIRILCDIWNHRKDIATALRFYVKHHNQVTHDSES